MKRILLALLIPISSLFFAQSVSCNDLVEYVQKKTSYPDRVTPMTSKMLAKVEYYEVDDSGLVIAYIKRNEWEFSGKPYIFCGISYRRWSAFKSDGMINGYGEAFHKYIIDYTCKCD